MIDFWRPCIIVQKHYDLEIKVFLNAVTLKSGYNLLYVRMKREGKISHRSRSLLLIENKHMDMLKCVTLLTFMEVQHWLDCVLFLQNALTSVTEVSTCIANVEKGMILVVAVSGIKNQCMIEHRLTFRYCSTRFFCTNFSVPWRMFRQSLWVPEMHTVTE